MKKFILSAVFGVAGILNANSYTIYGSESKVIPSNLSTNVIGVEEPVLSTFSIMNYQVLNIETGKFLFKKTNCDGTGYSFFSPFSTNPELIETTFQSKLNKDLNVEVTTVSGGTSQALLFSNFELLENGNKVIFDVVTGNKIFKSYVSGTALTISYVKDFLVNNNSLTHLITVCPPCAVIAIAGIVKTIVDTCTTASQACAGCTGNLVVNACSCSCTVKKL